MGESSTQGDGRALAALENAIKSPMVDANLSTAKKALINIVGGESLTLKEAETVFQEVSSRISPDAMLKWGARIEPDMQKDTMRVMLVVSGVEFPEYTENGIEGKIEEIENLELDNLK